MTEEVARDHPPGKMGRSDKDNQGQPTELKDKMKPSGTTEGSVLPSLSRLSTTQGAATQVSISSKQRPSMMQRKFGLPVKRRANRRIAIESPTSQEEIEEPNHAANPSPIRGLVARRGRSILSRFRLRDKGPDATQQLIPAGGKSQVSTGVTEELGDAARDENPKRLRLMSDHSEHRCDGENSEKATTAPRQEQATDSNTNDDQRAAIRGRMARRGGGNVLSRFRRRRGARRGDERTRSRT